MAATSLRFAEPDTMTRYLMTAAILLASTLAVTPEAEARRGRRVFRSPAPRATFDRKASYRYGIYNPVANTSFSRGERERFQRNYRWYQDAFNGFSPFDFH